MTLSGPLLLSPRLDPKPWGGRGLSRFGFALPDDELIGEALITASEAIVLNTALRRSHPRRSDRGRRACRHWPTRSRAHPGGYRSSRC